MGRALLLLNFGIFWSRFPMETRPFTQIFEEKRRRRKNLSGKQPSFDVRRGSLHKRAAREAFKHPGRAVRNNIH
jgi:hypothetical protein